MANSPLIDVRKIDDVDILLKEAKKKLEGKTLSQIEGEIKESDPSSRVRTKGKVGHFIEKWVFGIKKNSEAKPDIPKFDLELKTIPLKFNKSKTKISVKEPLSLNIINYHEEVKNDNLKESSLYKKNKNILFVAYLHDSEKERSEYLISKVFIWKISESVIKELTPDYNLIVGKIRQGQAHHIHQGQHNFLTLCPKHGSKQKYRGQPFSEEPAEIRAFRLKNKYMNLIINRKFNHKESEMGWDAKKFI